MSLLKRNQSAIAFIQEHFKTHHLNECACIPPLSRDHNQNARDQIDAEVVNTFKNWDKNKPIQLVDTMGGNLLQTATIIINLVNAGFKIEASIIDTNYGNNWERNPDSSTFKAIESFLSLIALINKLTDNRNAVKINGIFSHVDSYLAAVQGEDPPQYEVVPYTKDSPTAFFSQVSEKIASKGPRYIIRGAEELANYQKTINANFTKENQLFGSNCIKKYPDLILGVDDMSQMKAVGIEHGFHNEDKMPSFDYNEGYAFSNEILEPIKHLNHQACFIYTTKKRQGADFSLEVIIDSPHKANNTLVFPYNNEAERLRQPRRAG